MSTNNSLVDRIAHRLAEFDGLTLRSCGGNHRAEYTRRAHTLVELFFEERLQRIRDAGLGGQYKKIIR